MGYIERDVVEAFDAKTIKIKELELEISQLQDKLLTVIAANDDLTMKLEQLEDTKTDK